MKITATIVAAALALAFSAPAFAGATQKTMTTKEDCEKAGNKWDEAGKNCVLGDVGGGGGAGAGAGAGGAGGGAGAGGGG